MICLINGLNRHYGKLEVCRVLNLCQVHCFGQTCCHVYLGLCRVHWHMANSLCPVVRGYKTNLYLLTGAAAFCWAIWMTRNEVVFDKYRPKTFLQVLIQANILALILGLAGARWKPSGAPDFGMSILGDGSTAFLHFKWMVFWFTNWFLSYFYLIKTTPGVAACYYL